jgi:hypothetical protein
MQRVGPIHRPAASVIVCAPAQALTASVRLLMHGPVEGVRLRWDRRPAGPGAGPAGRRSHRTASSGPCIRIPPFANGSLGFRLPFPATEPLRTGKQTAPAVSHDAGAPSRARRSPSASGRTGPGGSLLQGRRGLRHAASRGPLASPPTSPAWFHAGRSGRMPTVPGQRRAAPSGAAPPGIAPPHPYPVKRRPRRLFPWFWSGSPMRCFSLASRGRLLYSWICNRCSCDAPKEALMAAHDSAVRPPAGTKRRRPPVIPALAGACREGPSASADVRAWH